MLHLLKKSLVLRTVFVVLCVAPVLLMAVVPGYRPADMMAHHLGKQLDSIPDPLVAGHLQQIAELDEPGTVELISAMSHPREIVAASAGNALHAQLDRWAQLPSSDSSPHVARLAELLASHVDQWDEAARNIAADLAVRILRWPVNSSVIDSGELLAHCDQVLQASPNANQVQGAIASLPSEPAGQSVQASHAVSPTTDPGGILELPLAGVPGGDLPIDEVQIPPLPPSLANPPSPRPVGDGEPQLVPPTGHQLPRVIFPDDRVEEEPTSVLPSSPVPRELAPEVEDDPHLHKIKQAVRNQPVDQLSDLDLIRSLHGSSPSELRAVEQQLRRRGFGEAQLSMARRVADPDPRVRRQLAESLANMDASPGPWLFWLSYDPDPLVRKLVVSLMATSQDPRLHRRLREMHRLEIDETVREQLDRLFD